MNGDFDKAYDIFIDGILENLKIEPPIPRNEKIIIVREYEHNGMFFDIADNLKQMWNESR